MCLRDAATLASSTDVKSGRDEVYVVRAVTTLFVAFGIVCGELHNESQLEHITTLTAT